MDVGSREDFWVRGVRTLEGSPRVVDSQGGRGRTLKLVKGPLVGRTGVLSVVQLRPNRPGASSGKS